jgi:hypothetical protein
MGILEFALHLSKLLILEIRQSGSITGHENLRSRGEIHRIRKHKPSG